eukprot:TRINITY_DN646_c0_g2_i2.p1 TRINITY_DN646_c0_g2~~TRINITY_DN646_c0_g2_i2.p1  ORF type:complete len:156 (-),score=56.77 TRINITY_DN646_c0_g2_i2:39-506(-)
MGDRPLFPRWILELSYLDGGNKAYLSAIVMHHMHNHPIAVCAAYTLLQSLEKWEALRNDPAGEDKLNAGMKRRRMRNRLFVAFLLSKNPSLKHLRKAYLKNAKGDVVELDDDKKKNKDKEKEKKGKGKKVSESEVVVEDFQLPEQNKSIETKKTK